MVSPRALVVSTGLLLTVVIGCYLYADARQGSGPDRVLAQAPLNGQAENPPPAFIMTVDDSGSMTSQGQFPAQDGYACWNTVNLSFFSATGLHDGTASGSNCFYSYSSFIRSASSFGSFMPPSDHYGFGRSPDFNPAYFDPRMTYEPWLDEHGMPMANASTAATRQDPRPTYSNATLNLTATDAVQSFTIRDGMKLSPGVRYLYGSSWITVGSTGEVWSRGLIGIRMEYVPAVFFLRGTGTGVPGSASDAPQLGAAYAEPAVKRRWVPGVDCGPACPGLWRYQIQPGHSEALQNFANWYSYYGNRNRAMVAAMTHSLAGVRNMRIGYQTINKQGTVTMLDMDQAADRRTLNLAVRELPYNGGTPNVSAVNNVGSQFMRKDAGAPIQHMCQKNAAMLFTDGYSAGTVSRPAPGQMGKPFDPTYANTMAAVATYYYNTNLRPDLPAGQVPVPDECATPNPDPRLDCKTNLHMNFYGITLGAQGRIFDPNLSPPRDAFVAPHPAWNNSATGIDAVDDIWHATVNTRGKFINARKPTDIVDAMRDILNTVARGAATSGRLAISGTRIGDDSLMITPGYYVENNSTDWYGRLTASGLGTSSGNAAASIDHLWEAGSILDETAPASRKIKFAKNAASGIKPVLQDFTGAHVSLDDLCRDALATCTLQATGHASIRELTGNSASVALAYLRGERGRETAALNPLRKRTSVLGDIVNSAPVIVAPQDDYGYRSLTGTAGRALASSYTSYLAAKARTPQTRVYVGANDGMLHAFDGKTGKEAFAYIPASALGHMGNLLFPHDPDRGSNQVFKHRFFVDGPLSVSDAHFGGAWKTVLVGTAGAGGRSVYALDVSVGSQAVPLWELNDELPGMARITDNLGHVLGKPVIVPVAENGGATVKWKAIFGNGYGSKSGKAVLFVVDIDGATAGAVRMITAQEAVAPTDAGGATLPNGLGNVLVLDRFNGSSQGQDGYADTVYAADQNGALWKFDLNASAASVSTPVFIAQSPSGKVNGAFSDRQAILGGLDATSAPGGGVMVYFGTGSFAFEGDPGDRQVQTFYAVRDAATGAVTGTLGRAHLLQQRIVAASGDSRQISDNTIMGAEQGWYLDLALSGTSGLVASGERFVGNPIVSSGSVVFPTYIPGVVSGCGNSSVNLIYRLSSLEGKPALEGAVHGDGSKLPEGTGAVNSGTESTAPIVDLALLIPQDGGLLGAGASEEEIDGALGKRCAMAIVQPGGSQTVLQRACGRQSWRQLQ